MPLQRSSQYQALYLKKSTRLLKEMDLILPTNTRNYLIPGSRVLLDNVIKLHTVKNYLAVYGARSLMPCSQELASGPCPEPDKPSSQPSVLLL